MIRFEVYLVFYICLVRNEQFRINTDSLFAMHIDKRIWNHYLPSNPLHVQIKYINHRRSWFHHEFTVHLVKKWISNKRQRYKCGNDKNPHGLIYIEFKPQPVSTYFFNQNVAAIREVRRFRGTFTEEPSIHLLSINMLCGVNTSLRVFQPTANCCMHIWVLLEHYILAPLNSSVSIFF